MLESIKPGFLKTGVYKYAQSNNLPLELLMSFTDVEIIGGRYIPIVRLTKKSDANLRTENRLAGGRTTRSTICLKFLVLRNPNSHYE